MIAFILFFFAGIANAAMDMIKFNMNNFVWKTEWWLEQGEWAPKFRSWLQKHVVTMISGGWHLMKFLMTALIITGVILYRPLFPWWLDAITLYVFFSIGFIVGYYLIWRKNVTVV